MLDIQKLRTWIMLYLISFVALLWAVFLISQGTSSMFWISIVLILIVAFTNFVLILNEIRQRKRQREMMRALSNIS